LFRPGFVNFTGVVIEKMPAYRRNPDQVSDRIKCPPSFTIILQHYFRGVAVLEYYHPATSPAFFTFHGFSPVR
jgi:hypothetical protein